MKCRLIAAGTRLPEWINSGFHEYQKRLRAPLQLELVEIAVVTRRAGESPVRAIAREGAAMMGALKPDDFVVALEVTGKALSTEALSGWLEERLRDGRSLALLIGGPDGLAPEALARANFRWSLSALTLPHGLVRVIVAEQIYRAVSIQAGHPYHRA